MLLKINIDERLLFRAFFELGLFAVQELRCHETGYHNGITYLGDILDFLFLHMDSIGIKSESQWTSFKTYMVNNITKFRNSMFKNQYLQIVTPIDMYSVNYDLFDSLMAPNAERNVKQLIFNSRVENIINGGSMNNMAPFSNIDFSNKGDVDSNKQTPEDAPLTSVATSPTLSSSTPTNVALNSNVTSPTLQATILVTDLPHLTNSTSPIQDIGALQSLTSTNTPPLVTDSHTNISDPIELKTVEVMVPLH